MIKFRDLRKEEIDCRVQSVKPNGIALLLYKDARVDQNILDETVGAENWQREHYECKGNLFCRVGIDTNYWLDDAAQRWVWKSDCGTESNTEAQKGEASDSFKRACFNWGIGRELYTAPFIWVPSDRCNITGSKCYDKFVVEKIAIENKTIIEIVILNTSKKQQSGEPVKAFSWRNQTEKQKPLTCSDCGKIVQGFRNGSRMYTPEMVAENSVKKYGRVLCVGCSQKEKERKNA